MQKTKPRLFVGSEIGPLKRVLLHRPELSLKRLTPSNCEDLLFDDVLRMEQASQEHDNFAQLLRDEGSEVLLLHELLVQTVQIPEARAWVLQQQINAYSHGPQLSQTLLDFLAPLGCEELVSILLGGLTVSELGSGLSSPVLQSLRPTDFVIAPIPNHLFTRDTSCWIYAGVSVNPMMKNARKRETVHLHAIYKFHPLFRQQSFDIYFDEGPRNFGSVSIEGGDVLVLGNGVVLIGISERSTAQAVELLSLKLFASGHTQRVIAIELPKSRACMHLDTVMTQLDRDCFTVYPEILRTDICAWELRPSADRQSLNCQRIKGPYTQAIARALGFSELNLISTGGDIFEAEREQWNDANNVLTLRPGVVVGYERNVYTIEKMIQAGIKVLTIAGEDLGRGRGGPRCMSCPIERDDVE